jgi:hypothetical protein
LFEPNIEAVETALMRAVIASPEAMSRFYGWAGLGARLAAAQTRDVVMRVLARHRDEGGNMREIMAHTLHALVLRAGPLDDEPAAKALQQRLRDMNHPLAWLPLHASPLEKALSLPRYARDGSGYSLGSSGGSPVADRPDARTFVLSILSDETREALDKRTELAVLDWLEHSNGRAESRTYSLSSGDSTLPLTPTEIAGLKLDWFDEGAKPSPLKLEPAQAIRELFTAAAMGGAYSHGAFEAEGRRRAWISAGALAGASADASFEEVELSVEYARWYSLGTNAKWFSNVAWDVSLLAQRSDGSLAILAATDTD